MATTRLIPMHCIKGQSIAHTVHARIDYATNPDKTQKQHLLRTYGCDPKTAAAEMLLTKKAYTTYTGQSDHKKSDILLYQIRQSFKPGEITPELAQKIGYELGLSFTKGTHQFIVATHTDKAHIHNHILFNATTIDGTKKFRNFLGSSKAIRHISDRLCLEHGLSIIENPTPSHTHYGKWLGNARKLTQKEQLKLAIDQVLAQSPETFETFLKLMNESGYTFRSKPSSAFKYIDQKRYTALSLLGEHYSSQKLQDVIDGHAVHIPFIKKNHLKPTSLNLILDLQNTIQSKKGPGYERWAKVFNLKQMAQTLNYLTEHNLTDYHLLEKHVLEQSMHYHKLVSEIRAIDQELNTLKTLKTHLINFINTKKLYTEYRESGYSVEFYEKHVSDILLHKAAKEAFNSLDQKALPSIKEINKQISELQTKKKPLNDVLKRIKTEQRYTQVVKGNVDKVMGDYSLLMNGIEKNFNESNIR